MAMATALMGMGKRSGALWSPSLRVAREIGPIAFDPRGNSTVAKGTIHVAAAASTRPRARKPKKAPAARSMMVPDSVSGARAPNSWTMEMLFSLSACVVQMVVK